MPREDFIPFADEFLKTQSDVPFNYVKVDQDLPIGVDPGDVIVELDVYEART